MKRALPEAMSASYSPALAAVELGFFTCEGLDSPHDLRMPGNRTYEDMRDVNVDFVSAGAHVALARFLAWRGVKLLCAQRQGMCGHAPRHRRQAKRPLDRARYRRIGAAPWVQMRLRRMLLA